MTHLHDVHDTDVHFRIDPSTKKILSNTLRKIVITQGDHNSIIITFELPRYIEGHDMMECTNIEVHYDNINARKKDEKSKSFYRVKDKKLSEDEEFVIFSWSIEKEATVYNGSLEFSIRFACITHGVIEYDWFTPTNNQLYVSAGKSNTDHVAEKHKDKLEQWKDEILEGVGAGVSEEQITKAVTDYLTENPVSAGATQEEAQQITTNKQNIETLTKDVEELKENGNDVDLSGYATKEELQENYQPKGDYLTKVPEGYVKESDLEGYATESFVERKIAEAELGGGEGEGVDLSSYYTKAETDKAIETAIEKVDVSDAVDSALAQAKASGEFNGKDGVDGKDGQDGYTPQKNVDYFDGKDGEDGQDGKDGITPHIGENGNWFIGDIDTGVKAEGTNTGGGEGVDLSAYYTKSETDEAIEEAVNGIDIPKVDLSNHYTKSETDKAIEDAVGAIEIPETDLSGYATKKEVQENYQLKGEYLTEHQPIKTINGESLVGEGDITIKSDGAAAPKVNNNVKSINHRGYNVIAPENTIPAYILSKQMGYEYVECDVSFTSDGVAVLLHDATIDRTSNGTGNISEMTFAKASQYDYGYWKSPDFAGTHLPTFKEFMLTCKGLGLHPYIELKSDGGYTQANINSIVAEVQATGMKGKVTYISFNATYLGYVKTADVTARLGYVVSTISTTKINEAVALKVSTNEVFIDAKYSNLTDEKIEACITKGLPLEVWSPNDPAWVESMHPYISGITTDALLAGDILYDQYCVYTPHTDLAPTPTGISLSANSLNFTSFTDAQTLTATILPANAVGNVTWTSSDPDVATVINGVVTPNASGTATITATVGHCSASCTVNVAVEDLVVPAGFEAVRLLKASEIVYRIGSSWKVDDYASTPPYTKVSTIRAGHYLNDIPVEHGYIYRIDYIDPNTTMSVGMQIASTELMGYINNPSESITSATVKAALCDPGWLTNGQEVEVPPADYKGTDLVNMRITFKLNDTTAPDFVGFEVRQVLVSRKKK